MSGAASAALEHSKPGKALIFSYCAVFVFPLSHTKPTGAWPGGGASVYDPLERADFLLADLLIVRSLLHGCG